MKAYVLVSGGIDSTTCLYLAHRDYAGHVEGISINYGQRHSKEAHYAAISCSDLSIPHRVVDVRGIIPRTMLTDHTREVPNISYSDIQGVSPTYVPYRNGLLLSVVASIVQGERKMLENDNTIYDQGEWAIYFGAHAEDAHNWAYPDCTPEFIGAMANAIRVGTYGEIRLKTPLEWMSKAAIITLAHSLGVSFSATWSCYKGEEHHCGTCPTCRARHEGFLAAGVPDPTVYLKNPVATKA
jgi:7-cyano-7-deazaguanine synthase